VSSGLTFTDLRAGLVHACGIIDGAARTVYCWGWNYYGQVTGVGTPDVLTPSAITLPAGVSPASLSMGGPASCLLGADGAGYCWGTDMYGELGFGSPMSGSISRVKQIVGTTVFAGIAKSNANSFVSSSCGWTAAGAVHCWGINSAGQIGAGKSIYQCSAGSSTYYCTGIPTLIDDTTGFVALATGGEQVCGITKAHTFMCWGLNRDGELGDGTTLNASAPRAVVGNLRSP
jgi:alpha-tubulin suppressor-like RCC1 family protein